MTEEQLGKVEKWLRLQRVKPKRFCTLEEVDGALQAIAVLRAERVNRKAQLVRMSARINQYAMAVRDIENGLSTIPAPEGE